MATSGEWVKIEPHEEPAAQSLLNWGMIERHHQTPAYARWSVLHERPTFGAKLSPLPLYGVPVHHLSAWQKELLVSVGGNQRKGHDVLTKGDKVLQRRVSVLERRGLLRVEKRDGGVWRLWIADTFPGYARPAAPSVPTGTSTANAT